MYGKKYTRLSGTSTYENNFLKKNGWFYTATVSKDSYKELEDIYKRLSMDAFSLSSSLSFTLENGAEQLENYFSHVEKHMYKDALCVIKDNGIDDLMDYVKSYKIIPESMYPELYNHIKNGFSEDGTFHISKEQGIFICKK